MLTKTFYCRGCRAGISLTVHTDGPHDPRVIDRFRLLAASNGWVIDLNGQAWCPSHKQKVAPWEAVEHPIYVTTPTIPPDMPQSEF